MSNITDDLGFVDVLLPTTSDIALGNNQTGFPGLYFRQLASRDRWLRDQLEALNLIGDSTVTGSLDTFRDVGMANIAQGRLTLQTATPAPSSDVTAATTLYYTPFNGDRVALWNSAETRWDVLQFTERSLSLSGLTANTNYDIFIWNNSGTLTLQAVAWTNSGAGTSARASAISQRNGTWVKTSDDRRYLGTIRITGTVGQCEDSQLKRFVWNVQNQVRRRLGWFSAVANWNYNSDIWRPANNDSSARVETVVGLTNQPPIYLINMVNSSLSNGFGAIALNNTTTPTSIDEGVGGDPITTSGDTVAHISIAYFGANFGYNFFQAIERSIGGSATFTGVTSGRMRSGLIGTIDG